MTDFSQWWWQAAGVDPGPGPGPGPDPGDPIGQSLRFRASSPNAGSCLSRSGFSNSGDVWTYSCWIKGWAGSTQTNCPVFSWHETSPDGAVDELSIFSNYPSAGRNVIYYYFQGSSNGHFFSNTEFNDPSAWYHLVWKSSSLNDVKLFVNGKQITDWSVSDPVTTQNYINKNSDCSIGARAPGPSGIDYHSEGYLAAAYFIDGQALDPTTFGRYNSAGVWVPVDPQGLTYGSNGFKLSFEDPSDLGKDYSGNGNDFTATGFETADTSSPDYDLMQDSPTQNYATWNPLYVSNSHKKGTEHNANLANSDGVTGVTVSQKPKGVTVYFEIHNGYSAGASPSWANWWNLFCITNGPSQEIAPPSGGSTPAWIPGNGFGFDLAGNVYANNVSEAQAINATGFADSVAGITISDAEITITCNGAATNVTTLSLGNTFEDGMYFYHISPAAVGSTNEWGIVNFGQQPFVNAQPAGTVALQTQNMPAAPIPNGREHFQAITDTGANILTAAQTAFPDGLWWIKDRVNSNQHQLVDSVNTQTATLSCPANTVGAYVAPAGNSVAWCWNWDQANPAANGFNIVQMNNPNPGPGGDAFIIDTGLTNPQFAIWRTTAGGNIFVIHEAFQPGSFELTTDSSGVGYTNTFFVGDGTISLEEATARGDGTMWAWEPVPGYSAFGSYQGNGDADGPLIYTGFSVAWVMVKSTATENWWILDTVRNPNNPAINGLYANLTNSEDAGFNDDILSNGFKLRETGTSLNASGVEYIYAAFASCPFQAPATAR